MAVSVHWQSSEPSLPSHTGIQRHVGAYVMCSILISSAATFKQAISRLDEGDVC